MKPIKNVMPGTISKNSGNQNSKNLFDHFDVTLSECVNCHKEFESDFKMFVPGKTEPVHFVRKQCVLCDRREEDRKNVEELLQHRERVKADRIKQMFDDESLINPKLKAASFETYQPTNEELERAKAVMQRYANNFTFDNPVSLLLMGGYGIGKSHLSMAVVKVLMEKGHSCIFISTPKLMTKIRSTYNKDSMYTEEQIIDQLSKVDCLVLDDIGAESTKQGDSNQHTWATSKLFEIIDNRIGKHTIFTTNYNVGELEQRLGGRNFSRMMEGLHVEKMNGDDYRLREFR